MRRRRRALYRSVSGPAPDKKHCMPGAVRKHRGYAEAVQYGYQ
jgi:hypothetical protein